MNQCIRLYPRILDEYILSMNQCIRLYPRILDEYILDDTTILQDNDPTPDSECHVVEWGEHVGCPHDPLKRKKKKKDVLCAHYRYRFRKRYRYV